MRIIGKSALSDVVKGQRVLSTASLNSQIALGRYIEIQLLDEIDNGVSTSEFLNILHNCNSHIICAVHTPLVDGLAVNLEKIQDKLVYHRLEETLKLAGEISVEQGTEVLVVVHNSGTLDDYVRNTDLSKILKDLLLSYFSLYPKLAMGIENVIPIYSKDRLEYKNGTLFENVDIAKFLSEKTGIEQRRIGTVLDVCHSRSTITMLRRMLRGVDTKIPEEWEYYQRNKELIKEIHLANVIETGLNKGEHGIAYKDSERDKMYEELTYYKRAGYTCDITIEVREADYIHNKVNFANNSKMLRGICEELNIPVEE